MNAHQIAIEVLLWGAVGLTVVCTVGMLVMDDVLERIHYMSPVAIISAFAIFLAVLLQEGWHQAAVKSLLVALVLFFMNAVLSHATARAARVRQFGQWQPRPEEHIGPPESEGEKKAA